MKGFMNIFPKEFPNKFPNRFTKIFDKTKTTQTLKTNKTGQHLRQGPLLGPTNAALHRSQKKGGRRAAIFIVALNIALKNYPKIALKNGPKNVIQNGSPKDRQCGTDGGLAVARE